MTKKYGLDFGTTNSSISIKQDGEGKVLEIDQEAPDKRVIRTLLYLLKRDFIYSSRVPQERINAQIFKIGELIYQGEQEILIGQGAVSKHINENKNRKPGIRRKILTGRMISPAVSASADQAKVDPVPEYFEEVDYGTGRLVQALKTALKSPYYKGTTAFGKYYSLEELIAIFIKEIKQRADLKIGENVTEVVCGRPVHFMLDQQKDAAAQKRLEQALSLAGFEKIEFQFEPVAAAKQFVTTLQKKNQLVLVFDFGGGTLDTAIVRVGETDQVLSTDGVYIGGDLLNADIMQNKLWNYFGFASSYGDYNQKLPAYIFESLSSWYSIPNLNNPDIMALFERLSYKNSDPKALVRLIHLIKANLGFDIYEAIEKAKKQLSTENEADIIFSDGPIDIKQKITRTEFESIIKQRVEEIRQVVLRTLKNANVQPSQIDVVVRTGGSSLIPIFESMLVEIFGKEKIKQFETFTSIASGLAL